MAMVNLPRAASSAASSHACWAGSTRRHDPGVDGQQREVTRLDLEEGRALEPRRHTVLPAKLAGLGDQLVDPPRPWWS